MIILDYAVQILKEAGTNYTVASDYKKPFIGLILPLLEASCLINLEQSWVYILLTQQTLDNPS